jgi:HD-GYP domain-containing protein (c-di-GMP phosphodiesterase class II)
VVDAYDVMTNGRPYKKKLSREAALVELRRNAGTQFDPELIEMFYKIVSDRQDTQEDRRKEYFDGNGDQANPFREMDPAG